jgi:AcrR family transcriptional regulator
MTSAERREQLIDISRVLFAERGFEGTSIEEVASRAGVSKPIVYEHFGGKEGLYAVVVDREVRHLLDMMRSSLTAGHPRELLEQAAFALLDYIEQAPDGFRILVRDSPIGSESGSFVSIIGDIATRVEYILEREFKSRGFDAKNAPMYAQMLVGMVGTTGQWWLDARKPGKDVVAAHLVNLAWHGLSGMEKTPELRTRS